MVEHKYTTLEDIREEKKALAEVLKAALDYFRETTGLMVVDLHPKYYKFYGEDKLARVEIEIEKI